MKKNELLLLAKASYSLEWSLNLLASRKEAVQVQIIKSSLDKEIYEYLRENNLTNIEFQVTKNNILTYSLKSYQSKE